MFLCNVLGSVSVATSSLLAIPSKALLEGFLSVCFFLLTSNFWVPSISEALHWESWLLVTSMTLSTDRFPCELAIFPDFQTLKYEQLLLDVLGLPWPTVSSALPSSSSSFLVKDSPIFLVALSQRPLPQLSSWPCMIFCDLYFYFCFSHKTQVRQE